MPEHKQDEDEQKPPGKKTPDPLTRDVAVPQVGEVTIEEEPPVRGGGPPRKIHSRRPLPPVPQKCPDPDPEDPGKS